MPVRCEFPPKKSCQINLFKDSEVAPRLHGLCNQTLANGFATLEIQQADLRPNEISSKDPGTIKSAHLTCNTLKHIMYTALKLQVPEQ